MVRPIKTLLFFLKYVSDFMRGKNSLYLF